jgi:hypothetical protein
MSASPSARPLDFLGASALARARRAAAEALEEWRLAWGAAPVAARVECARIWEIQGPFPQEREWWSTNEAWLGVSPELAAGVENALFGASAPLAGEVARRAVEDLARRLLSRFAPGAVRRATPELPAALRRPGSGFVVLDIELGAARLRLVARAPRAAEPALRTPAPLGDLPGALQRVAVTLDAQLAELDLELGVLHSLEAGDVIRLPSQVDQPLRLAAPDGRTVCLGDLGRLEGCRALALRKPA